MSLKDKISKEIIKTIEDDVLIKSEKRELKALLKELGPSKQICDVLRSEVFHLANEKINETNYMAIVNWIEDLNKVLLSSQKIESINERIYFSPGEDCLNAIIHQIKSSQKVIKICLFTISDNRISEELVNKHRQGVNVKIITDNDKMYDKGSDIKMLHSIGIPIKIDMTDNHMHHKFALFDKKTTITGSYNWTRSAERYNHENIVISDSGTLGREFEKEFNKLWDECIFYEKI